MNEGQSPDSALRIGVGQLRDLARLRLHGLDGARADELIEERLRSFANGKHGLQSRPSDYDLNPDLRAEILNETQLTPAAVLVPVIAGDELRVLLSERTDGLRAHAAQIAFPGGKPDPGDSSLRETALRETFEEIGLGQDFVEALGYLDPYETRTGYLILPLVGLVRPGFQLQLNKEEVADCFDVPISYLMNPEKHEKHSRFWRGKDRYYYAIRYQNRYIWGATAGIIRNMYERLVLG